jgi:hypothetical protein
MIAAQELALNFLRLFGCPAENIDSHAFFRIARVAWASCPCVTIQQDMGRMPMPRNVFDKAFSVLC